MKAAKGLGLDVPRSILLSADELHAHPRAHEISSICGEPEKGT
jgi:hypothetical protein